MTPGPPRGVEFTASQSATLMWRWIFQSEMVFSDNPVSCAMAMLVRNLMLMSKRRMRNCCKESFCPESALSVRMFLILQGGQRQSPYQQVRRFGSRARNQVHGCVAGGAGKRLFQDPSAKQEVPGMFFCVCDEVDLTV